MESNVRRIVSEATRLCREQGHKVDPLVIGYVASLQGAKGAFDGVVPGASLSMDAEMDAQAIAAIGQLLLPMLASPSDLWVATARMQVVMETTYRQQREVIEKEQGEQQERSGMLQRAVTGPRAIKGNSADAYEKFYKLLLEYVCVQSGMELALHDETAAAEVRAAVESVFPISAIARYMTLEEAEKATQIEELARIATGICLYNRAAGRGGHALPAAAAQYLPQAQRLLKEIAKLCQEVSGQLRAVNSRLEKVPPAPQARAQDDQEDGGAPPAAVADPFALERQRLQAEALHRGQALQLFESLQADLQEGLDVTQQLDAELDHLLVQVHDGVGSSAAVSKDVVYPLFDRLGSIHTSLHDELRMLVVRQRLYDELVALQTVAPPAGSKSVGAKPGSASGKASPAKATTSTAAARSSGTGSPVPRTSSTGPGTRPGSAVDEPDPLEQLTEATMTQLDKVENGKVDGMSYVRPTSSLQLQGGLAVAGFCPVSLTHGSAAGVGPTLRRANPALGYLSYAGNVYGFASNAAVQAFVADPAACLEALTAAANAEPLLVRLLGLPAAQPAQDVHAVLAVLSGPLKVDFGCQTPVHFLEKNIDPNYEWNVWALRRRALALANLRDKATHSAQTAASHFRRDNDTQTWKPKEAVVQTKVNKGQAMPKKLQYVAGLRGAPDVKMNVVRLQLDLGQPHQH